MFVITYDNPGDGAADRFVRLNATLAGALAATIKDCNETMTNEYNNSPHRAIQCRENVDGMAAVVSIINPNDGHVFECYTIDEYGVGL